MKARYFVRINGRVLPAAGQKAWAAWYRKTPVQERVLRCDDVNNIDVVTSFVGLGFAGKSCVYQTVMFGGPRDGDVFYFDSEPEALRGHEIAVQIARNMV